MIGESPALERLRSVMEQVAACEATILVTGESGSGKELVARGIHAGGRRSAGPFVAINCAAMPAQLLESALFGHVRGAFTDASSAHAGLFARAHAGTLFLDEVGEMPIEMQAKLLRVVEEKAVRAVGSDVAVPVDVRLITATNRDLAKEVAARRFRADLYYRLNVIEVAVPPLRERGRDILLLAESFLQRHASQSGRPLATLDAAATRGLLDYAWPGNVRELENSIQRAVTLSHSPVVSLEDFPESVCGHLSTRMDVACDGPDDLPSLKEFKRRHIAHVLNACGGNKSQAARILAVDRRTLYRLVARFEE
jgi:transcriptional regulator with PAS, ATPase and Fis domain